MRIACWISKATNTHSVRLLLIAFPLQHWLHEGASVLRYSTWPVLFLLWWTHNVFKFGAGFDRVVGSRAVCCLWTV